eukprot:m.251432 g.251432  ORF g.251432 m.251432 type:complete len:224 (-) comp17248_c0_seq1:329-1000(-)
MEAPTMPADQQAPLSPRVARERRTRQLQSELAAIESVMTPAEHEHIAGLCRNGASHYQHAEDRLSSAPSPTHESLIPALTIPALDLSSAPRTQSPSLARRRGISAPVALRNQPGATGLTQGPAPSSPTHSGPFQHSVSDRLATELRILALSKPRSLPEDPPEDPLASSIASANDSARGSLSWAVGDADSTRGSLTSAPDSRQSRQSSFAEAPMIVVQEEPQNN